MKYETVEYETNLIIVYLKCLFNTLFNINFVIMMYIYSYSIYNDLCDDLSINVMIFENECHKFDLFTIFNFVSCFGSVVIRYSYYHIWQKTILFMPAKKWQDEIEFNIGWRFAFTCVAIFKLNRLTNISIRDWTFHC